MPQLRPLVIFTQATATYPKRHPLHTINRKRTGLLLAEFPAPKLTLPAGYTVKLLTLATPKIKISIFTYFIDNDMDCRETGRYAEKLSGPIQYMS
jgi:hypothetical protein